MPKLFIGIQLAKQNVITTTQIGIILIKNFLYVSYTDLPTTFSIFESFIFDVL